MIYPLLDFLYTYVISWLVEILIVDVLSNIF